MWLLGAVIPELLRLGRARGEPSDWAFVLAGLPFFLLAGLLFGALMKFIMTRKPKGTAGGHERPSGESSHQE
jgi:hypothetical protein